VDDGSNCLLALCLAFQSASARKLSLLRQSLETSQLNSLTGILDGTAHAPVKKRAITNHDVLNEAYAYAQPSSFSRGMRIDLGGLAILLISGTASIDEHGQSVHIGDFPAQLRRTFDNITGLLASEGATWHDVVRTSCYLRDINRDYVAFNAGRTAFFKEQELDPLPASTGIQAKLCRPELLVEIQAIAMYRTDGAAANGKKAGLVHTATPLVLRSTCGSCL
jgi:2-iminobutanoate/2-iminopropanoate deaminase